MTDNGTVRAARKAVARRLADALIHSTRWYDPDQPEHADVVHGLTSGDLSWMSEAAWTIAVNLAKERDPSWHPADGYSPSPQTRHLTATIIRYRLQADTEQDPFSGLGYRG
jgi:hypothetical protein